MCVVAVCTAAAMDRLPTLTVRQQGEDVFIDADAHVQVPAPMEAALRNGVPMVATQSLSIKQSRWYWRDAVLLNARREWTIAYQALTNQWRVTERLSNETALHPTLEQAWSQVTDVRAWRFANVVELGALHNAQLTLRWYIDRKPLSNLAPITSASAPPWHVDVVAQTTVPQLIAPVRDALPASPVR
jgi:hypothetical protein